MPSIASRMVRGGLWIAAARAIANGLGFIGTLWLARLLVPADFGLVALGASALAIVSAFTALPVSEALIQHRNPQIDHFDTAWTLGILRAGVVAALLTAGAVPMGMLYQDQRLVPIFYALAFSVLLSGFGNPRRIMLNKELVFWQDALVTVGEKIVFVGTAVTLALHVHNYWALVIGMIAGQAAAVVLSYSALPYRPRFTLRHARDLWSFSVWLSLGQIVNTINWRFDQLLLGGLMGRAALGQYTVGDNLAQLPTREALAPLTQPLYPALARVADDPDRLRAAYQRTQAMVTAVALPVGIGFALVASPLIIGVMGAKWAPAVIVAQALASVFALQTLGSLVQPLGMATGATKLLFKRDLQMFGVRLPIVVAGIYLGGLPGLVAARVCTGLLAAVVNMLLVRQLIDLSVRRQLAVNARSLVAVAVMAGGVGLLQASLPPMIGWLPLVQGIASVAVTGGTIYGGTLFLLWRLTGRPAGLEADIVSVGRSLLRGRSA